MTNYVSRVSAQLAAALPDCDADLIKLYTLLALTKGTATTLRDVHDAWAVWRNATNPEHRSLVDFDQLDHDVQELDRPYCDAIHAAAPSRGRRRPEPLNIEIVERVLPGTLPRAVEVGLIVPSQVRLDGTPIACPRGEPIVIHEIAVNDVESPSHRDQVPVKVSLTLWARSVRIGFEEIEADEWSVSRSPLHPDA